MENNEKTPDNTEFESKNDMDNDTDNKDKGIYAAAIKCIFDKPKNIMGAFCLLLRKHDSKIVELVLWTTKSSQSETGLNLSVPWEDFSTKIPSIGPIDKESCEKLKSALKGKLSREMIGGIFKNLESNETPFSNEIKELIEKNLRYSINFDLKLEPFSQERLKNSGYERDETPSDATETANTENVSMAQIMADSMDKQVISCSGIVDPVNGIAASHLKEGDLVEVVIPTNSTTGMFLLDYYAKLNKTPEFPVRKVSFSENGGYIINLEADGGVTCIVKTSSDLRLRAKRASVAEGSVSGRKLMIIIAAGIAVITLAVIALIKLIL